MKEKKSALQAAFPTTIPVLTGFTFLGIAYGILMSSKGYGVGWTFLMSLVVFAGSAQYAAVTALTSVFNPLSALLLTLVVNARHLFYGVSMLDTYKNAGKYKLYLIFGLCDETFSIVCSAEPPEGVNRHLFMFFVTLLDHFYWVLGSVLGGVLGAFISFNIKGLDFVLTALFVVIFLGQWQTQKNHAPAVLGVVCAAACLLLFGPERFIIPAMLAIVAVLSALRKKLTPEVPQCR
ncbi:4-azaleucine resistance probable transporter AzlC [Sporobacter termitidis DSM 10068]|uniref:4-azaleucine resistance probable transporter AzlC n=1 Tax=Sporobacter termitidis DSM 10068 TaxID=1123282 RepID=A0A1M5WI70_9FIRM|nr:AzlC family ABC transporter permease [Sporobacter termitidis]SHH86923.1 4-azaleucine resistance probable transporter AzlC [Sporobacter termitidis DSM 10068]